MGEYIVCVFGSGGVGKSCLTMQFVQNIFMPKYDPTIEDVYKTTVEVDEKQYSLEILDTAGSEEFSSMRDLYVKTGHGFVLVYSITSRATFDDIHSYYERIMKVKDIETHGRPPMILVGNKTDLESERTVSREAGQALAGKWNCSFLETSAKNRANVTEIFYDLIRQINRNPPTSRTVKRKAKYVDQPEPHMVFEEEIATSQSKTLIEEKPKKCCILF